MDILLGGAILRGLRRCSYTTIWAGLLLVHPGRHIALCDSGTPASPDWELARNRHYITHTPDCRGAPPIVADSRALPSPSALKPSAVGAGY